MWSTKLHLTNSQSQYVNLDPCPALIIGTHKEAVWKEPGGGMFWGLVTRQPLQGHPIVCWKFLHVLHKVMREGHSQVRLHAGDVLL